MVAKTGRGPGADRGDPPQPDEPAQPRVLDHELAVDLEVALEPLGGRDPLGLPGRHPPGLEPRLGPRVADLDQRLLEQPVVVVDHPARLTEALGVGLVGVDLGLRHVQPQDPHQAGHRAGAAAAGAGDEQHLARVRRAVDQASARRGRLVTGPEPIGH